MNWQILVYLASILLTSGLTGLLAWYAWKHRDFPGARTFAGLALSECLLSLFEVLSVFSPTIEMALFWFRLRYTAITFIGIFWFVFALDYSGRKSWLSRGFLAGLLLTSALTQALLWSNSMHGLWVKQEAVLYHSGNLWLADTAARVPSLGYLAYSFYALFLALAGIAFLLWTAWKMRRTFRGQALLLLGAALTSSFFGLNSLFSILPKTDFNPFTPGIGLSVLLAALAVFRFEFLKRAPSDELLPGMTQWKTAERHSLTILILLFLLVVSGIAAAAYFSYTNYEHNFRTVVDEQLSSIADLKVSGIQEWRAERLGDAEVIRHNQAFAVMVQAYLENPAEEETAGMLKVWLNSLQENYQYSRIVLLDSQGATRLSSPTVPEVVDKHIVDDVAPTLSSGKVVFLDFHRHSDGKILLGLMVPVYSDSGQTQPLGVLVMQIDPTTYLYPYLDQWPAPSETAETLLVRREGDAVLFLNPLRFRPEAALNLSFPLTKTEIPAVKTILGVTGIVEGLDYRGMPVVADIRPIPNSSWFLVSKMDTSEVYAPLRERLWETILFFGIMALASGAGLLLFWRREQVRNYQAQVNALEALRESEEKFKLAFETSPDAIAITRLEDGKFVWANRGFEQILGYTEPEVIGKTSVELGIWADPVERDRIVAGLHENGRVSNFEAQFLAKNGKRWTGLISATVIYLTGMPHILNVTHDITERRRIENEIISHKDFLETIIESSPFSMWISDAKGVLLRSNQALRDALNVTDEQIVGIYNVLEDRNLAEQGVMPQVRAVFDKGIPTRFSIFWKEKNEGKASFKGARDLFIDVSMFPIKDRYGKVLNVVCQWVDITDRANAEEELKRTQSKLRLAMDLAKLVQWEYDVEADMFTFDDQFYALYGTTAEKEGGPLMSSQDYARRFLPPEEVPLVAEEIGKTLTTTDPNFAGYVEHRITRGDGTEGFVAVRYSVVKDEAGRTIKTIGANQDITDRKMAEEKLRKLNDDLLRSNKELQQFAYIASHDLQEPLRMISSYLQLIEQEYKGKLDAEADEFIGYAVDGANRLQDMINALLVYSRVETQKLPFEPVDSETLLAKALLNLKMAIDESGAEVTHDPLPTIFASGIQITQVFQNLISNAIKFRGEKPPVIHISARLHGNEWIFSVQDNGIGIEPQYRDQIFVLFKRLHGQKYSGTGIGLALCKRIVERHGGRIWFESEPGKGTTFHFTIPKREEMLK